MGIDINCGEQSYSASYGNWSIFRNLVIYATVAYLKNLPPDALENEYQVVFEEFLQKFQESSENYVDLSSKHYLLWVNPHVINMLISLGLNGLCSFCYKNDCEGYYSVGNSYDICQCFV